jgi:hypothetical protein
MSCLFVVECNSVLTYIVCALRILSVKCSSAHAFIGYMLLVGWLNFWYS